MTAKTGNFKNRSGTVHVGHLLDDGRLGHLVCGANGAYGPSRRGNFQPTTDEATCKRCLKITAPAEPAPAEPAATEPAPAGPLTTGGMVRDSVTGRLAKVTALDHGVVAVQFLNPVAKTIRYVDQLTPVHPCPRCKWCDGTWLLTVVRRTAGGTPKVTRFGCTAELRDGLDAYGVPRGAWRDGFYGLRGERYEWRRLNTQS